MVSLVWLIIPAWNEADTIGRVLAEVQEVLYPAECTLEIVVIDGGSIDNTVDIARAYGVRVIEQIGRGYGSACFTGFQAATEAGADILLYMDGDYSDPPASIPDLLRPLLADTADLVLGVRHYQLAEKGALLLHAFLGNILVVTIIRLVYGQRYRDIPPFRALRRETLVSFAMQEMTYGWPTEMLVKAARLHCRITEIPIAYRRRGGGQSKVSGTLRGTIGAGYHLIRTAFKYRRWTPVETASAPVRTIA